MIPTLLGEKSPSLYENKNLLPLKFIQKTKNRYLVKNTFRHEIITFCGKLSPWWSKKYPIVGIF